MRAGSIFVLLFEIWAPEEEVQDRL